MISTQHLWHHREPNASPMTNPANVERGLHMDCMDGTWAAPEHYRCYQIYIPKTQDTRIFDTVELFPTHHKMPNVSSHDAVI